MPIDIPEFTTKEDVVRPDLLATVPDPKTDVTAAEWNELAQLAVATATEVNAGTVARAFDVVTELPVSGNTIGDALVYDADGFLYVWDGGQWIVCNGEAGGGGVPDTRAITAGTGLTGGGTLAADRTLSVDFGPGASKVARAVQIETLAGTSDTIADGDDGKVVRCTAGTTVTITVPSGLTPGVTVEYVQEGAGQVQIAGSGVTLRHGATFDPYTAEQWSSVVVTILDTDEALVRGDLAAA